jgi:radical SAM superfamily enzyme
MKPNILSDEKHTICQSCGMPITMGGFYGTNKDGSRNEDYCAFCYQNGEFTEPKLTKNQMVRRITKFLKKMYPEPMAKKMAKDTVKNLKRWKHR